MVTLRMERCATSNIAFSRLITKPVRSGSLWSFNHEASNLSLEILLVLVGLRLVVNAADISYVGPKTTGDSVACSDLEALRRGSRILSYTAQALQLLFTSLLPSKRPRSFRPHQAFHTLDITFHQLSP